MAAAVARLPISACPPAAPAATPCRFSASAPAGLRLPEAGLGRPLRRAPAAGQTGGRRRWPGAVVAQSSDPGSGAGASPLELAAGVGGVVAVPVVAWSLFTLRTTGCGLPPGPGGSLGALEGVSYLVVVGLAGWSVATKLRSGGGLPAGPFGLLGAAEGLTYLTLLAAVVVFGLQLAQYGYIPPPVPGEQCFG
eukprot:SM000141S00909  [mRNA]  locus=s141:268287:269901:- [translate_table: standard]